MEHIARLAQSANHDVLVFAYDVVEEGGSHIRTWEPARVRQSRFASNLVTPLGVARRREPAHLQATGTADCRPADAERLAHAAPKRGRTQPP